MELSMDPIQMIMSTTGFPVFSVSLSLSLEKRRPGPGRALRAGPDSYSEFRKSLTFKMPGPIAN